MLFVSSSNKMFGCARLAALQQFEYRFNLFADTIIQPLIVGLVEITLWYAFFKTTGQSTLAGFDQSAYISYAFWAAFISRISTSWMYEMMMIEDVSSGTINSVLVRPISFFEYYLGQFMGYKVLTTAISLVIPVVVCHVVDLPINLARLPLSLALVFYYLIFVHMLSVVIASLGFFFTRVHHLTVAKNISLWMMTGEFFPLDLAPEPYRSILEALPFSSGVYRPVGYVTERLPIETIMEGFVSVTGGILVLAPVSALLWSAGRKRYSGTGA